VLTKFIWYNLLVLDEVIKVPLSGKEMCKLYLKAGWVIVPKQGKGSHVKFEKDCRMAIVPMHRELKTGTEHKLLKELKK